MHLFLRSAFLLAPLALLAPAHSQSTAPPPATADSAAAKKKAASASGEVAAAPTRESPMRGAKSLASERIATQLSPVARVPVAVSVIAPRGDEESPKDQAAITPKLPPLWNAWYSTCCQVLHFVGDGGALVGNCASCGNGSPGRKDIMLDPEQLAELRTTPSLVYDPLTGSVFPPLSRASAPPSYPRGQVRRSPQKFKDLDVAKGREVDPDKLEDARSDSLSDEGSDSSHSSPRAAGTKTAGMLSDVSPFDSPMFTRNGDDFSAASPTDNEVSKYSFFERLKHYMEGNQITDANRASVELCILVEAGAAVRGMDPMKKVKKETVFFNKYMATLDEIEDSMFDPPNLREYMRLKYKNAKKENTGTSLWRKYEAELTQLRNFSKKIPGVGRLSELLSGSNQLRHMKKPLVEALWREKHPVLCYDFVYCIICYYFMSNIFACLLRTRRGSIMMTL